MHLQGGLDVQKTPQEALHALVVKQDENAKYNRHPRGLAKKLPIIISCCFAKLRVRS